MQNETEFRKECTEFLKRMGFEYLHIPNRVFRGMKNSGLKDWPDYPVICLPDGKSMLAELKIPGGVLSKGQKELFERLERLGHKVHIFEQYNEFTNKIDEILRR